MSHNKLKIVYLIKFMKAEYVSSFLDEGLLYMNTLDYFRTYEESDEDLRADEHEGLSSSIHAEKVTITMQNGSALNGVVGKVDFTPVHAYQFKLYCFTAITLQDLDMPFYLDERFKKFGDKAIVIKGDDLNLFWGRLKMRTFNDESLFAIDSSLKTNGLIEYVSRKDNLSSLTPFNKFSNFSWQKEFRIALESPSNIGALSLRIGSLKDIASVIDTNELLRKKFHIKRDLEL